MRCFTRRSLTRWGGILLFVALLLSAACTGSTDPLAADASASNVSPHAAGEGYIGPAESKGNAGSTGSFPLGGGATGRSESGSAAGGSTQANAAAAAPSPSPEASQ